MVCGIGLACGWLNEEAQRNLSLPSQDQHPAVKPEAVEVVWWRLLPLLPTKRGGEGRGRWKGGEGRAGEDGREGRGGKKKMEGRGGEGRRRWKGGEGRGGEDGREGRGGEGRGRWKGAVVRTMHMCGIAISENVHIIIRSLCIHHICSY